MCSAGVEPRAGAEDPWFWVAVLFKAAHPKHPRKRHLWERTVFLVRAPDEAAAGVQAREVALSKEHEYVTAAGDQLHWTFQQVEEVQSLHDSELRVGTEVY